MIFLFYIQFKQLYEYNNYWKLKFRMKIEFIENSATLSQILVHFKNFELNKISKFMFL
jgi:hypothetical protein